MNWVLLYEMTWYEVLLYEFTFLVMLNIKRNDGFLETKRC